MKRLLLLLLAYAVGGAIINVAVAWGCALRPLPFASSAVEFRSNENLPYWKMNESRDRISARLLWMWVDNDISFGSGTRPFTTKRPSWSTFKLKQSPRTGTECMSEWCVEDARGWPLLATTSLVYSSASTGLTVANGFQVPYGRKLSTINNLFEFAVASYKPIWPGFAINTIFYAAVLWLLFAAPFALRRRLRARRGQCPACAYPVGSSDVCTECGRKRSTEY
jgi:hypothetical protein